RPPRSTLVPYTTLFRSALNEACAPIVARMTLHSGNSLDWMNQAGPEAVDVVYLDPMFPHRDKSALVKKEMQVFRQVVGDDDDARDRKSTRLNSSHVKIS